MTDIAQRLRHSSPAHNSLRQTIRERKRLSAQKMKKYHQKWDDADDGFRAYQPTSEVDAERKALRRAGQHQYTTVVVPYTFAIVMTAHTYWSSVFLSRAPVYQLQGRHGESQNSVEAFEAVLEYQKTVGQHMVPLFNWIFDMSKYGLGIIGDYWDQQSARISRIVEEPMTIGGIPLIGKTRKVNKVEQLLKYEGARLFNVRPYDWYPDPRVALTDFQRGEFVGRDTQVGWHEILEGQESGRYFNVDTLAKTLNSGTGNQEFYTGSSNVDLPDQAGELPAGVAQSGPGFVKLHEMDILLIPRARGLTPVEWPEKWKLTLANDEVIIGATPQGLYHDEFPFSIMEFGQGAHEFLKISLPEIIAPLIDTMSWLFNSHFYNVRKALNDVRVVDPSRIVMKDLTSPVERGIVRLKPEAYGTDVRQAVHQLDVRDVTQTHMRDAAIIEQIVQRVSGVVDELMGLSTGPSRESATGVRTRTGFAANRLKTVAEYNSNLGMTPLIARMVSNTQQLMTMEKKFRIAGASSLRQAKSFMEVNRDAIAGQFDYVPVDGTMPIDRLAQANFWKEMTIQLAQAPQLMMQWDLSEMIAHIMHLQGEKNVDRFRLDMQDPEAVQEQVQAGNLLPVGGGNGGGGIPAGGTRANGSGSSGATV